MRNNQENAGDTTIEVNRIADVPVDKYIETIEMNNGVEVHIDKYIDNAQRRSA